MSLENDKEADRSKAGAPSGAQARRKQPTKKKAASNAEVGGALRSIYKRTVEERIPPDLLDLLGKLG